MGDNLDEFLKTMKGALKDQSCSKRQRSDEYGKRNSGVIVEHIRCSSGDRTEERIPKHIPSSH